jgi:hypothetical protein
VNISISNILTAFDAFTIGSKVENAPAFLSALRDAVASHDTGTDRVPGQHFIIAPDCIPTVSAGDGPRPADPEAFVPALHRGRVDLFLRREHAGDVNFCACIVYTMDAYLADPEVDADEHARLLVEGATHVLVAVIASSGPEAPLTPHRLVSNLAGGNREALDWTKAEIHEKAEASIAYWDEYAVVAG